MMELTEYQQLSTTIIDMGYESEIQWAQTVAAPEDAVQFATEHAFVVCNSGMKAQIARSIFEKVMGALGRGEHPSTVFGHKGKTDAIWTVWNAKHDWFGRYLAVPDDVARVEFLQTMPWIGGITKWHLAKNFGLDVIKPDRHLVRLGIRYNTTPQELCRALAEKTGERVGTIDYVLWRACNLGLL